MKRGLVAVVVLATLASPHATDAGKKRKKTAEAFELAVRGSHETRAGVTVHLEVGGHGSRPDGSEREDWLLRVGDDQASASNEDPWVELVSDGKLYQGVPSGGGLRVTVLPAGDAPFDDEVLVLKVEAEAAKRRLVWSGGGQMAQGGVLKVFLNKAATARIGTWSGKLLSFEVDPYATITPALPAGAKTGRLVDDGEVTVGGVKATRVGGSVTLRKGKKSKTVDATNDVEVVALGKLVWVRGDELIVAPAKKLAKKAISAGKAIGLVEAEAARRGIPHDGTSAAKASGVMVIELAQGSTIVARAVVGARTKRFLRFDVSKTGLATPVPQPVVEPEPSTATGNAILDEHNRYRADHCAPALIWSDELARTAQQWAEHLRDDACGFYHSGSKHGENLAGGLTGSLAPEDVVGMWYREVDFYDFANGGFSMDTGHFTQVVWKKTTKVGCGMVTDCDGMDLWVCNYDPPGNYEDQFEKNVLPTSCR